ncbi:MAG: FlgD immunoglobulin-like domain containing protein, partial [Candidatus Firestonebacteria bacterium]
NVIDNQTGDDTWRSAAGTIYDVDFSDTGESLLNYAQYTIWSSTGQTGTQLKVWTDIATGINASSYTTDWPVDFAACQEGTNYVSVRIYDNAGNSASQYDVFYVKKLDITPPGAITDLAILAGYTGNIVKISWTSPGDDGYVGTATSYVVKYSTNPINNQIDFDNAITYTQNPIWTPWPAGNQENKTLTMPVTGVIYYIVIETKDEIGNQSALCNIAVPQIDSVFPDSPVGIKGTFDDTGHFVISWSAVNKNQNGNDITDLSGYRIYRSTNSDGDYVIKGFVSKEVLTWTDSEDISSTTYYYVVKSVDFVGNESSDSMGIVCINNKNNNVSLVFNNAEFKISLSDEVNDIIYKDGNQYNEDIRIRIYRQESSKKGVIGGVYEVKCLVGYKDIQNFMFLKPADFVFNYEKANNSPKTLSSNDQSEQNLAVFWYDHVRWIKLGGKVDTVKKTISIKTTRIGEFMVRETIQATEFKIRELSPAKIFTPRRAPYNKVEIFFDNPQYSNIDKAKIYDITGAEVADLQPGSTENSLMWDGTDKNGNVVHSGVYIYQIEAENKVFNGTIVVAK